MIHCLHVGNSIHSSLTVNGFLRDSGVVLITHPWVLGSTEPPVNMSLAEVFCSPYNRWESSFSRTQRENQLAKATRSALF